MTPTLYTIGYAGRSSEEFLALLAQRGITALADVRSIPYSRRHQAFNREPLKQLLAGQGIEYVFLGDELGARAKDLSCYIDGKAVHRKIATTASFRNGLDRIRLGLEKGYVLTLMCAEKDPLHCHRSTLICRNLRHPDLDIRHIREREVLETQTDLEKRLVSELKLHPDMFEDSDPNSLVERAYDIQADRIAYIIEGDPGHHGRTDSSGQ